MKAKRKKLFSGITAILICLAMICTVWTGSVVSSADVIGSSQDGANAIVFANWDPYNTAVDWANPDTVETTYNADGSLTASFTGNSGQPQCILGLTFNNEIARAALQKALAGSKKLTFTVTYLSGKNAAGSALLTNQLNVFLGNSTKTVSYNSAQYANVHRVVLDVSELNAQTSFAGEALQIQAQNYSGQGLKDVKIKISPIYVLPDSGAVHDFSKTAVEFVKGFTAGWNLGNTFENLDASKVGNITPTEAETMKWNPVTTKAMIDTVKAQGFNVVRIPCTWMMFVSELEPSAGGRRLLL